MKYQDRLITGEESTILCLLAINKDDRYFSRTKMVEDELDGFSKQIGLVLIGELSTTDSAINSAAQHFIDWGEQRCSKPSPYSLLHR